MPNSGLRFVSLNSRVNVQPPELWFGLRVRAAASSGSRLRLNKLFQVTLTLTKSISMLCCRRCSKQTLGRRQPLYWFSVLNVRSSSFHRAGRRDWKSLYAYAMRNHIDPPIRKNAIGWSRLTPRRHLCYCSLHPRASFEKPWLAFPIPSETGPAVLLRWSML